MNNEAELRAALKMRDAAEEVAQTLRYAFLRLPVYVGEFFRCRFCGEHDGTHAVDCWWGLVDRYLKANADELAGELRLVIDEAAQARADLDFHPRAAKLMRARQNFIVVADDERYFLDAYWAIKEDQQRKGRWTDQDERAYRAAVRRAHGSEMDAFHKEVQRKEEDRGAQGE